MHQQEKTGSQNEGCFVDSVVLFSVVKECSTTQKSHE